MRSYELVLVLKPDITGEERKKLIDTVGSWLGKAEVELKELGKKALAYQIKKQREGIYFLLDISYTDETIIPDLDKKLLTQDGVLRHLLIRKKVKKEVKKEVKRSKKSGNKKS